MSNAYKFYIGLALLSFGCRTFEAKLVHQMHILEQGEEINGMLFSHIVRSNMGKREELFFVDKVPVRQEEYEDQLEQAHLEEFRKQRKLEQDRQLENMNFKEHAQMLISQKLANQGIAGVQQWLVRLDSEKLKPYLVFDENSVESMQDLVDMRSYVQKSKQRLEAFVQEGDMQALLSVLSTIEPWPIVLENLFKDSVKNAVKQCDDTALLKELLTLLSD